MKGESGSYRGRIAPSPTGFLHAGHALTFWTAQELARESGGVLVLRIEDIDRARCRPEFVQACVEDLRWCGLKWDEGGDCGGPFAPYVQSLRRAHYVAAWREMLRQGLIYPCFCSRRDIQNLAHAPHAEDEEPVYPGTRRPAAERVFDAQDPMGVTWRFRVPEGETLAFEDGRKGPQSAVAGRDFGDFVVWRRDDVPSYQLAVTADDIGMRITEVVRGEDLLLSTFRQLLLYRALLSEPPRFYHCGLVRDAGGNRLAKRAGALSLRELRAAGTDPEALRAGLRLRAG